MHMQQDSPPQAGRAQTGGEIAFAVASNDEAILRANLMASPVLAAQGAACHVERNAPSAAIAYNRALDAAHAPYLVFVHQDVYLPRGWDALLRARIDEVTALDPDWALLGAYGCGLDAAGIGPVWSSSLGHVVGRVADAPVAVQSFDELLIVMRRDAGLRFDEGLPGFHLFGTDIVQTARAAGAGAYAAALPLVHNDGYHDQLGDDFIAAYRYLQRKWRARLPLVTPVTKISWHGLHLTRARWQNARTRGIRKSMVVPAGMAPEFWAARCGWHDLTPKTGGTGSAP